MSFITTVETTIERYGQEVKLINDDIEIITKAFIEPLRYRHIVYIGGEYRNLNGTDKYLYVGKPKFDLKEGKTIIARSGIRYVVERTDTYMRGGDKLYDWAIIKSLGN